MGKRQHVVEDVIRHIVASNKFCLRSRWEIGKLIIREVGIPKRPGKGGKLDAFCVKLSEAALKRTGSPYAPSWFYRSYQAARFIPGDYLEAVIACMPTWEHLRILFTLDDKPRADLLDEMAVTGKVPKRLHTTANGGGERASRQSPGRLDHGVEVARPDTITIEPWPDDDWEPLQIKFEALLSRFPERIYQIEQAFVAAVAKVKKVRRA